VGRVWSRHSHRGLPLNAIVRVHRPQMQPSEIETLPLHDASLESVEVLWAEARCRLVLSLHSGKHLLEFRGVTRTTIPHEKPWGPSISINEASFKDGVTSIEMQTGDTIEIVSQEVYFGAL
jgi:hypothetical protein